MHRLLLFCLVILSVVYLNGRSLSLPQPQEEEEEDYASYATLYPEIAKKIGEEPIEIIDVVKAILVYDSDDDATTDSGSAPTPGIPPTEGNSTVELF